MKTAVKVVVNSTVAVEIKLVDTGWDNGYLWVRFSLWPRPVTRAHAAGVTNEVMVKAYQTAVCDLVAEKLNIGIQYVENFVWEEGMHVLVHIRMPKEVSQRYFEKLNELKS